MSAPTNPNPNINDLDAPQCIQRAFDGDNDALRMELASGVAFDVTLSQSSDSVTIYPVSISDVSYSVNATSSTIVLGPVNCTGVKSFQLYTNTTTTITGPEAYTLQVSPSDTDNVWYSTSTTVTPSVTVGVVEASTVNTGIVARRAQVIMSIPITTGTFDLYLTMSG
jgi:hypothetical protein